MTQFRKWLKAAPALAMAAVISGAVYGFTLSTAPKKVLTTDWYFTGDNTNEIMTASAWTSIDPENQDCDLVTEALPCKFTSNTALADSVELIQYFQDEYAGDESQVVADAESWRPEP